MKIWKCGFSLRQGYGYDHLRCWRHAGKMEGAPSGCGGTLVYFGCDDRAVEASRAAKNGGSIFKEKTSIGEHGFYAIAYDTEGNKIGFHSM